MVTAAAKIVKEETRLMNFSKEFYPSVDDIVDREKWVPESLENVMAFLVPSSQKQLSLSLCIIQATRPGPFGVAVNIGKSTGCKELIQHFLRLGFSITPDELYRFKQSATEDGKSEVKNRKEMGNGFKQWVADNVDHDIATFMGKGTFHGMGTICIEKKQAGSFGKVPRLKNRLPAAAFAGSGGIEIVPYQPSSQIRKFQFEPISAVTAKLLNSDLRIMMSTCNFLWHTS